MIKMRRMFKRFYGILILIIFMMSTLAYMQFRYVEGIIKDDIRVITNLSLRNLETEINHWINRKLNVIQEAGNFIEVGSPTNTEILSYLKGKLKEYNSFSSIYYGTKDNVMINASGWIPPAGFDLRERPWYMMAKGQKEVIITDVFLNASKDDLVSTIAKPVYNQKQELIGVVGGDISIKTVVAMVGEYKLGRNGESFLLNKNGELLAHSTLTDMNNLNISIPTDEYLPLIEKIIEGGTGFETTNKGTLEGYLTYTPIENTQWILASFTTVRDFYAASQQLTIGFILVAILSLLIFYVFLLFLKKSIIKPLITLENSVSNIDIEEDITYRIDILDNGRSEFRSLVDKINALLDKIEAYFFEIRNDKEELQMINEELEASLEQMIAAEEEIMRQKKYFEALFTNSSDGIVLLNQSHHIIDLNQRFTDIFGYKIDEIKGKELDSIIAKKEIFSEANGLTHNLLEGQVVSKESIRYRKNNEPIDVLIKGVPILYEGHVVGGYGIYTDISERKKSEREILYISYHDRLTGLYNRTYFEGELKKVEKEGFLPISIIMGDVNGLKMSNDAFGHDEGDRLLRCIAEILNSVCTNDAIPARIGGDEFAIILTNTDEKEGLLICNEIKKRCTEDSIGTLQLSLSLGLATMYSIEEDLEETYKLAENRMYDNKLLESKSTRSSIIASLLKSLEEKTHETEEHSSRMMELGLLLGKKLELNDSQLNELRLLAALHDIGKIAIPDHILDKEGPLTEEEWNIMRKHSEIGYRIASATPELANIAEAILHHHERWDGKGYPYSLEGDKIPLSARVIAVVDAYDAMTSDRPYRRAMESEAAILELSKGRGKQFDPLIVDMFLEVIKDQ